MRLYPLLGQTNVADPDSGEFEVDENGALDVPENLGAKLHGTHIAGNKAWEDSGERQARLLSEEEARRRDPASLLAAVEALSAKVDGQPAAPAPAPKGTTKK